MVFTDSFKDVLSQLELTSQFASLNDINPGMIALMLKQNVGVNLFREALQLCECGGLNKDPNSNGLNHKSDCFPSLQEMLKQLAMSDTTINHVFKQPRKWLRGSVIRILTEYHEYHTAIVKVFSEVTFQSEDIAPEIAQCLTYTISSQMLRWKTMT